MSDSTTPTPVLAVDPVTQKLNELGVKEVTFVAAIKDSLGANTVEDLIGLTEADLVGVGMKPLPARALLATLKREAASAAATAAPAPSAMSMAFDAMLPAVPDEGPWLAALKAGGVLKVDQSTVIAAARGSLANRVGLFDVPDKLVKAMETFADENEEQVSPEYFKLRKQLTRRSYADLFAAIEGFEGSYVTEGRKTQFLSRFDTGFWPAVTDFYGQLKAWQEAYMQGAASPAMMVGVIAAAASGGGMALPPGLMAPPETGGLRDHADAVADAINRSFAGVGVQVAAALAYDAVQITKTLMDPRLPALIGVANRDQMLKRLAVAVPATYPRLETNLTRFVLGILQLKDQPAGREELSYLTALHMLGSQIPWETLGSAPGRGPTGIGGTRIRGDSRSDDRVYPSR